MKPQRTTVSGTVAAACLGAAQVPSLPHWAQSALYIGAAVALAQLGYHAKDCPVNCPGTDENGDPRPPHRQLCLPMLGIIIAGMLLASTSGCVAPNPEAGPGRPDQPAYVVSPQLTVVSNAAVRMAKEAGDLTQTGPLLPMAAAGVFALAGAVSGLIAQHRSHARTVEALKQANSTRSAPPPST